ncbi:toxin (plasmid) [Erwinia tracheiphila]|uniref:Toxin n=1 Tax=Erwinia tracheiphila TaxID=65700 RepID=A0A345CZU7_9GAMM|nr:toxin [Erwinia tracheiphila]AXF78964.1 toxin [Erwinia tracheiphila]UIA85932.1 toxin [Erwinia tracheiphila]UIA94454.1 toxin [Erwinia tracheiphila]
MYALFIELSSFEKYRANYLNDDQFRLFQRMLLADPEKGDLIPDTGGLRKVRYRDERRNKGTRGGIRVIYYWTNEKGQFILFTIYDKEQRDDLTKQQRDALAEALSVIKKRLKYE